MFQPILIALILAAAPHSAASVAAGTDRSIIATRSLDNTLVPELLGLSQDDPAPADLRPSGCERLVLDSAKSDELGWRTLIFKSGIDASEGGTGGGVMVIRGDEVSGFLRGDDGRRWRILASDGGTSSLEWIDDARMPTCAGIPQHAAPAEHRAVPISSLNDCDTGKPVDVLVLYTTAAKSAAGGKAAVEGQIAAAFSSANLAYQRSAIATRINPVMVLETDYVSSDFNTDLVRLSNAADGQLDFAHSLRDVVGADMIALIRADGEYCGIAWLMYDNSASAANEIPFSVTAWSCLANQTFAHELGHNMGCCHANGDGGGCTVGGLYSFSVGWRFNGQGGGLYRTVMAYDPGSRIDNFSNPNILFDNRPTGVPIGQANEADNATTIGLTDHTVVNFRCSHGSTPFADCDHNGVLDPVDIAFGVGSDCDNNGALDSCALTGASPCTLPAALAFCPSGLAAPVHPSSPVANDYFGKSGAISATTAVIGIPGDDAIASFSGRALVYRRSGENWIVSASLKAPDAEMNAQFGNATETAPGVVVVGAPTARSSGVQTGRVYVYAPSGATWALSQVINCPEPTVGDLFGEQVALDGNTLVIGARGHQTGGLGSAGAAFVFQRPDSDSPFDYATKLVATTPMVGAAFGSSVSIHGDKIAVGAPFETVSGSTPGAAYVFVKSGGAWLFEKRFQGTTNAARFGQAIAIESDRLAVGAPSDAQDGYESGAVFMYRFAGTWLADTTLRPGYGAARNRIGTTLSLSGERLVVGVRPEQNATGAVSLYFDTTGGWQRQGITYAGNNGYVHGDAGVIGGPFINSGAANSGGAEFLLWSSDCNGDGLPDRCNIDLGSETDCNGDGIPDSCQPPSADINGDGVVDGADVGLVLLSFGDCPCCPEDLSRDGVVDGADVGLVLLSMGE
ncbi:MAG: hypothetical protein K8R92_07760 [Planctomycetes bacterium]|nr:hypothetical protein [Planctomycetota bacterium]